MKASQAYTIEQKNTTFNRIQPNLVITTTQPDDDDEQNDHTLQDKNTCIQAQPNFSMTTFLRLTFPTSCS